MKLAWPPSKPDAERNLNAQLAALRADIERLRGAIESLRRELAEDA